MIYFLNIMERLSAGHRGEVFTTIENNVTYAVKRAKTPEKKGAIKKEIVILQKLKGKLNFVPQIVDFGDDFFKYRFIEGITLNNIKNPSKNIFKQLLKHALDLDLMKVEHGELSKPTKNIIISPDEKVFIIDFERGNLMNNKSKNLRAIANHFYNIQIISKIQCQSLQKLKNPNNIYEYLFNLL